MLKPQDVLSACKIYALEIARQEWSYALLAREVGLSQGEAHNAVLRCHLAQIITPGDTVSKRILRDVLAVALPRMCFAIRGSTVLGVPTGVHAPVIASQFGHRDPGEAPLVWAVTDDANKDMLVKGLSLEPIYPSVPLAACNDSLVYELLALVDVIRTGSSQDRQTAISLLDKRFK